MILEGEIFKTASGKPEQRGRNDTFRLVPETQEERERLEQLAMMAAEFGAHGERVRQEFVRALIETMFEEEEKLSPAEFAESAQLIVGTFDEYDKVWQSSETAGPITMRLGALAFERILGRQGGPPNYRVWDLLFKETNNVFKTSVGIGKRFKIVA